MLLENLRELDRCDMGIKRKLKNVVENITGWHIFRFPPFGVSITDDIAHRFPEYRFDVIFDVGANVGQSALKYVSNYPHSAIYCFEPITATYEQLKLKLESKSQVQCLNLALSDIAGQATMISEGVSTMNSLVQEGDDSEMQNTESVKLSTLDEFCKENNIEKISYLKIDTEGGDLNVLKGSKGILNLHGVDFVEVEAGMNPTNTHHAPFESLKNMLESHGYFIFGIYEQMNEWIEKKPYLRRLECHIYI